MNKQPEWTLLKVKHKLYTGKILYTQFGHRVFWEKYRFNTRWWTDPIYTTFDYDHYKRVVEAKGKENG